MSFRVIDWPDRHFYIKLVKVAVWVIGIRVLWIIFTGTDLPLVIYVLLWPLMWAVVPLTEDVAI